MKKANRAEALEWQEQQKQEERNAKHLEEQLHLLYHAGVKRKTGFPDANLLKELGYNDVYRKLSEAYSLMEDAYELFEQKYKG